MDVVLVVVERRIVVDMLRTAVVVPKTPVHFARDLGVKDDLFDCKLGDLGVGGDQQQQRCGDVFVADVDRLASIPNSPTKS